MQEEVQGTKDELLIILTKWLWKIVGGGSQGSLLYNDSKPQIQSLFTFRNFLSLAAFNFDFDWWGQLS